MILLKKYESLNDVLVHLKYQVVDSMQYIQNNVPRFNHPKSLFYYLRAITTYKNDPDTIELLMTAQTMLSGSHTGTPGAGDCDDFTILGLAGLINCGFVDNFVILSGNNKTAPVHIYIKTNYKNKIYTFDLTNPVFNTERKYKYYQTIKFKI